MKEHPCPKPHLGQRRRHRHPALRTHPELDPLTVRFTDLHRYVTELPDFKGDPKASNEGKLEAIQMAWHEEVQDRTQG